MENKKSTKVATKESETIESLTIKARESYLIVIGLRSEMNTIVSEANAKVADLQKEIEKYTTINNDSIQKIKELQEKDKTVEQN